MKTKKIYALYDKLNQIIFDDELPPCNIERMKANYPKACGWLDFKCDGLYIYINKTHNIGLAIDLNDFDLLNTLIHEMIHVKQKVEGKNLKHGKYFNKWCKIAYEKLTEF